MDELGDLISTWVSTVVLVFLAVGLYFRHQPSVHIKIMLACFVVDVANVLYIELRRGAVEQTLSTAVQPGDWLLKFHIIVSVLSLVGYVVAVITGTRLYRKALGRRLHRGNACAFLLLRVLNYVTSFYV